MLTTENMILVGLLVIAGLLFMKFVYWTATKEFRELARLQNDPEFRQEQIDKLSAMLESSPNDPALLLKRSHLWQMDSEPEKSMQDIRKYLTMKSEDTDAWAQLAECALEMNDTATARQAAEKAIELDPDYRDYRVLLLRTALSEQDIATASEQLEMWKKLDAKRVDAASGRKFIFKSDEKSFNQTTSDPAINAYQAALFSAEGKTGEATELVELMQTEHAQIWDILQEHDPLLRDLPGGEN